MSSPGGLAPPGSGSPGSHGAPVAAPQHHITTTHLCLHWQRCCGQELHASLLAHAARQPSISPGLTATGADPSAGALTRGRGAAAALQEWVVALR